MNLISAQMDLSLNLSLHAASNAFTASLNQSVAPTSNDAFDHYGASYSSTSSHAFMHSQSHNDAASSHLQHGSAGSAEPSPPPTPVRSAPKVEATNGNWRSALNRFHADTQIYACIKKAYEKWYQEESQRLQLAMMRFAPGSTEYARLYQYLSAWSTHTNAIADDARVDKNAALRLALDQYENDVDEQRRLICEYYQWFATMNSDEADGPARQILLQTLQQVSSSHYDTVQAFLNFHNWYSASLGSPGPGFKAEDDMDEDDDDSHSLGGHFTQGGLQAESSKPYAIPAASQTCRDLD
jgi:hypothetical protein